MAWWGRFFVAFILDYFHTKIVLCILSAVHAAPSGCRLGLNLSGYAHVYVIGDPRPLHLRLRNESAPSTDRPHAVGPFCILLYVAAQTAYDGSGHSIQETDSGSAPMILGAARPSLAKRTKHAGAVGQRGACSKSKPCQGAPRRPPPPAHRPSATRQRLATPRQRRRPWRGAASHGA